jgi:hypothetical protein
MAAARIDVAQAFPATLIIVTPGWESDIIIKEMRAFLVPQGYVQGIGTNEPS